MPGRLQGAGGGGVGGGGGGAVAEKVVDWDVNGAAAADDDKVVVLDDDDDDDDDGHRRLQYWHGSWTTGVGLVSDERRGRIEGVLETQCAVFRHSTHRRP